jgi:hypothetical protein
MIPVTLAAVAMENTTSSAAAVATEAPVGAALAVWLFNTAV